MKQHRQRKCRHCGELFRPDPRNLRHQHYCGKPECRKASKAASQRRWLAKGQNRDYFRGAANVIRVRAWRAAHPGYRRHRSALSATALQDDSSAQATETDTKSSTFAGLALQDLLHQQPVVLIGLIANLTGAVLQEDIARTARRLQQLGQDIVTGARTVEGGRDAKTRIDSVSGAPGPPPVQLGGSALGA